MVIMNTNVLQFSKFHVRTLVFVCAVVSTIGGLLLYAGEKTAYPVSYRIIDDFNRSGNSLSSFIWIPEAAQTIDNGQDLQMKFDRQGEKSYLHIKGHISSGENFSIIGIQPGSGRNNKGMISGAYEGIYLRAKNTGGIWTIGLWTTDAYNNTKLYQAPLELKKQWQEIKIPFRRFQLVPVEKSANNQDLVRISSRAGPQKRTAEILLDEIGYYREKKMFKKLTPEEKQVIVYKGTEEAFTGKYDNFYEKGTYTCKRCGAELYKSSSKFKSGCGWPSFDDEIPGAIKRQIDADGVRTEILCANCGAHLGHVFEGEGYTEKNVRHCVNSISMNFVPAKQQTAKAIFASGCFWGTEYYFQKAPGVLSTTVGYTGGHVANPTYEQVCTDKTGHAESVEIEYDPSVTSYEQLAKLFFETHDFSQLNRQGPDVGTQYRSAIFYLNDEQKRIATQLVRTLKRKGFKVMTEVTRAGKFWPAENYHQDYYQKTGGTPYCHIYRQIF
jgi:peptide methionine sulfoxide reductase msrA/msrB